MTPLLASLMILALVLTDIISATFYSVFEWDQAGLLRLPHEALAILLGLLAALSPRLPGVIRLNGLLYLIFILAYALVGLVDGQDFSLVMVSSARLGLPLILFGVGFFCCQDSAGLRPITLTLIIFGVATTLFGYWDKGNTDFWTEQLRYGEYLMNVKGVLVGYRYEEFLPFNFFGFEEQRRAGGLLAAPLAQGSVLATACLAALGRFSQRLIFGLLLTAIFLVGIYHSGTRGAMVMVAIALPLFLLLTVRGLSGLTANISALVLISLLSLGAISTIISYTVGLEDGSTIGHVYALEENLAELGLVSVIGLGVGSAGANAADLGLEIAGGGEGAFFSIAFQLGLPGALSFLLFYGAIILVLGRAMLNNRADAAPVAALALMFGAASSLPVSEHLLTVSGMGPFWIFIGAATGSVASLAKTGQNGTRP